jgi:hypothetical protein
LIIKFKSKLKDYSLLLEKNLLEDENKEGDCMDFTRKYLVNFNYNETVKVYYF